MDLLRYRRFPNIAAVYRPVGDEPGAFEYRVCAHIVAVERDAVVIEGGKGNSTAKGITLSEIDPVAVADRAPGTRGAAEFGTQLGYGAPGCGGGSTVVAVVTSVGEIVIGSK